MQVRQEDSIDVLQRDACLCEDAVPTPRPQSNSST
jgi:hypothetical protein